jgi:hypothetical protein
LDELQKKCNDAAPWQQSPELNNAVAKARTAIQEELDRVAFWFTRSSGPDTGEYELDQAVDIALQMIRNIYPKHALYPQVTVEGNRKLVGRSLSAFVGILFILLDNIVKYSGIASRSPNCRILIDCRQPRTSFEGRE